MIGLEVALSICLSEPIVLGAHKFSLFLVMTPTFGLELSRGTLLLDEGPPTDVLVPSANSGVRWNGAVQAVLLAPPSTIP